MAFFLLKDCSGALHADDNHFIGVAIGVVPLMVGIALLIYAYRLAPEQQQQ